MLILFDQEILETRTKPASIVVFDFKTIRALLEYVYYGGCNEEGAADPADVLKATHMYELNDLVIKCELRLYKQIRMDNISSYMALAETFDLPSLTSSIFLYKNIEEIKYHI